MSAPELERAQTRASNDSSPPKKQVGGARPLILRLHFYAGALINRGRLIKAHSKVAHVITCVKGKGR